MNEQARRYLKLRDEFAHYQRSHSLLHEAADNRLIEYRRVFTPDRPCLWLESRVLRSDGTAYEDGWYLVTDAELVYLNHEANDLLSRLSGLK